MEDSVSLGCFTTQVVDEGGARRKGRLEIKMAVIMMVIANNPRYIVRKATVT